MPVSSLYLTSTSLSIRFLSFAVVKVSILKILFTQQRMRRGW